MNNCQGPCFNYCYYKYSIIFIIIGVIIGTAVSQVKSKTNLI